MLKLNSFIDAHDLDKCVKWLKNGSFKKISLEIPDNLLSYSTEITLYLQNQTDSTVYVVGDRVYENCCNDKLSAEHIQADASIHFGHACLSCNTELPTFYVFPKKNLDVNIFCEAFSRYFEDKSRKILFFYDISFAHYAEYIYNKLKTVYENLVLTHLNCCSNVTFTVSKTNNYQKTVLGRCFTLPLEHTLEMYDAIFLGPNDKTLLTLSMSIASNTWHYYDSSNFKEFNVSTSVWLKRRNYLVEKIRDAQTFGIVIASLNINDYLIIIDMLKSVLKKVNKKVYLFSVGKITPTKLANFQEIDIFVCVTCPESSLVDSRDYFKPIVTPFEVELAFNDARTFSPLHLLDFRQILPGGLNYKEFVVSTETDVSLTSGKLRNLTDEDVASESQAVSEKSIGALMNSQIDPNFLQSRTWSGLEQKLGETEASLASKGRDGIPINYANEKR